MAAPTQLVIGITPFERPDPSLVRALARAGALAVLDLGRDEERARVALDSLAAWGRPFGVRIPEEVSLPPLPENVRVVVLTEGSDPASLGDRQVLVQVSSVEAARVAAREGADGLIVKGSESGGRAEGETAFVLLQRVASEVDLPLWVQGGIGRHTAAAAIAGGAAGVVLDAQLALARESTLSEPVRTAIAAMDGSETEVHDCHRIYVRPGLPVEALVPKLPHSLGGDDLTQQLLPAGQDASFASRFAERYATAGRMVQAVRDAVSAHIRQARSVRPLDPGSAFARAHGLRYPIAQGPMTRVSDVASFAEAVSRGGALPFLALALMPGQRARTLLVETAERLGELPWGVGILGFVTPELRDAQLEAIREVKPPAALIAGGRPAQARALENEGIPTWIHAPSPGLLDLFLKDGARRFIFEGRECGGHVGPRSSFVLWETAVERLLDFDAPNELDIIFAGGIHDDRSAAMVSALAAPLAARGARIGVIMGTAYLFTAEAVTSGAIVPGYQDAALSCEDTTLLETAPGHSTRCVDTHYVQTFREAHEQLATEGKTPQEVWAALEQLNLGRLRIASKGVRREGDALVEVDPETQRQEGMFMIGQVAALHRTRTTIAELHDTVSRGAGRWLDALTLPEAPRREVKPVDVAIVGMAGFFPDAPDLDRFWANIVAGRAAITEVPSERWNPELYYDPDARDGTATPSKWGGFLPAIDFDPLAYGIPPRSLAAIEPVQLLALEAARRALDDAGYAEREFDRERASVIFGAEAGTDLAAGYGFRALWRQYLGEMPAELDAVLPSLTEDSFPGVLANVIAGRIANRLDFGGVNYTVDAACASSLAAVDLACKELSAHTSDLVVCGGADLHNAVGDYLLFSSTHALSPKGRCATFDAEADGIVLGEGVATLVLKRLADAERDGDRIYAVIKGVAGSSDGKSLGLTAPRKEGQMRALQRAYDRAGVSPAEVGLVEAHGTGTVVGDRTELGTLTEVFTAAGARAGGADLGSVKSNVGHTKCAAGLAGVIKIALALHHRTLPPTLNLQRPNPAWDRASSPFAFRTAPAPWPGSGRHAGVSAFGFGGTNFHAVLAAHDEASHPPPARERGAELFLFRDLADLDRVTDLLERGEPWRLREIAQAVCGRGSGPVEVAVVASSPSELRERVASARARVAGKGVFLAEPIEGELAFLFPGQGSQRPGMLAELMVAFPRLQRFLELGERWVPRLYPPAAFDPETGKALRAAITDTRVAQPTLGIVDLAAAELLRSLGLEPSMLGGHSYGELVALAVAGAIDEADLLELSEARGIAILDAAGDKPGTMAAVAASADVVAAALADLEGVVLANYNAPKQTVIAGSEPAVDYAVSQLESEGLAAKRIPVACAFHSPLVAGAADRLGEVLDGLNISAPQLTVYSNTHASPYEADADAVRRTLAEHVARPVRFLDQVEAMYADGARVFVEAGPGRVLTDLVGRILGDRPHLAVAIEPPGNEGVGGLLTALAQLAVAGIEVDTEPLFSGRIGSDRTLDLERPAPLRSRTGWRVDGFRAVPLEGELPDFALTPVTEPLSVGLTTGPKGERAEVMLEYLRGVRQMAQTQRDVMLSFMGHPPDPVEHARVIETRTVQPTPPAPEAELPAPAVADAPPADPKEVLLDLVSERTGYPKEMLDLDLDLEADLSIDSIKRVEIIGVLAESLGLGSASEDERDRLIEELARVKSLRGILDWLEDQRRQPARTASAAPTPADVEPAAGIPERARRFVLAVEDAPVSLPSGSELAGHSFAVWEDTGGVGAALGRQLLAQGATVRPLGAAEDAGSVDALVVLAPLDTPGNGDFTGGLFAVADAARRALAAGTRSILVATALGGALGRDGNGRSSRGGGVAGLFKALAKEWPDRSIRVVHLDPAEEPDALAAHLAGELAADDRRTEVARAGGRRRAARPIPTEPGDHPPIPLDESSVVLITGGARGITGRVAVALARRTPATLVLVGRSPPPMHEEDPLLAGATTLTELRRKVVELELASSPADAERMCLRILADREIRSTFAALRRAGTWFEYHSCDVSDREAFGRLIDSVYQRLERIDLVIHGAGVNEDKLLRDKTEESFRRVVDTKVQAALALDERLRDDVKLVVFFSSVAGAFGNRGQSDYAAANDALDKLAAAMDHRLPGRVVSIGWGPWAGGGMVTPDLEREYARRGIGLIDPEDGVERLLEELVVGGESHVLLMRSSPDRLE